MINSKLFLSTTITTNLLGFIKYKGTLKDSFHDTEIERLIECICLKALDNDYQQKDNYIMNELIFSKYAQFMIDVDSIRIDSKKKYNSINIDYDLCDFICKYLYKNNIRSYLGDLFILICKKQFMENDEFYSYLDMGCGGTEPYDFFKMSIDRFINRVSLAMDRCSTKYNTKLKITKQKREEKIRSNAV